jgi:hypothetical protein
MWSLSSQIHARVADFASQLRKAASILPAKSPLEQRTSGLQQPGDRLLVVGDRLRLFEIPFDVFDRGLEDVQPVGQIVELRAGDDEFALGQTELRLAPMRFVLALPAASPAVELRSPALADRRIEPSSAPFAAARLAFRH